MNKNKCNDEFGCTYSKSMNQEYPRLCIKCGYPETYEYPVNGKWYKYKSTVQSFHFENEPELIHIIKTVAPDMYIIVHEDAYQINTGKTEILNKEQIKNKFNIQLTI